MPKEETPFKWLQIPLSGRLRTAIDGTMLEEGDFQTLKNMRYGERTPRSISGMTKINTTIINATYFKPRSGFHFRKSQPSESHLLIQAWNTGETASILYQNTTAIPSQGSFSATALWTDTSGASIGKFTNAPDGCVAYCNGKDSLIWGGNEYRCGQFIVSDPDDTIMYDYSQRIINTLSDANNIAIMKTVTSSWSNVVFLFHFDTDLTDAATGHDATAAGGAAISATQTKFGAKSCYFDGTGDYLTVADHADLDLSAVAWSIDFWVYADSTGGATQGLFFQGIDATNYMDIELIKRTTTFDVRLNIMDSGAPGNLTVDTTGNNDAPVAAATWTHIEVSHTGDNFYIFVDGSLRGTGVDTDNEAENYTSSAYIGSTFIGGALANYFTGYIDEYRVSNVCRHTSGFTPMVAAYGITGICYAYIASTRPI